MKTGNYLTVTSFWSLISGICSVSLVFDYLISPPPLPPFPPKKEKEKGKTSVRNFWMLLINCWCINFHLSDSDRRQILLASEIVVCIGILLSFHIINPYSVPQYVCSGLIVFVSAEVLEGEILFSSISFLFLISTYKEGKLPVMTNQIPIKVIYLGIINVV